MVPEASAVGSRPRSVSFGPFTFDVQNRLLSRSGTEIPLPPRVLGVLELLLSRPGEIVSRQELLDRVWRDAFVTDTSLAEAVSFLRQALGDDPQAPRYVQTVHRRGYRFLPPLTKPGLADEVNAAPPSAVEPIRPSIARDLAPWSITAACVVLAVTALWQTVRRPAPEAPPVARFQIQPADGTFFDRRAPALAISRDGRMLAWSGCDHTPRSCELYIRSLDQLAAVRLKGTEGAVAPFFSPDGRWIGFFADGR
ncbi:MAG TPA: winged helix-turn-helix domain-containing protein, partial [Vicinamibacterales bacterium]